MVIHPIDMLQLTRLNLKRGINMNLVFVRSETQARNQTGLPLRSLSKSQMYMQALTRLESVATGLQRTEVSL